MCPLCGELLNLLAITFLHARLLLGSAIGVFEGWGGSWFFRGIWCVFFRGAWSCRGGRSYHNVFFWNGILLVKVIWVRPTGESATWESESRMRVSYPELFSSGNFRGRKFFLVGESCNNPFFAKIILINFYMCLYVIVCDCLSLCVFWLGLVEFCFRRVF